MAKDVEIYEKPEYTVNGIDLREFKKHPRLVELRFSFIFEKLVSDWGAAKANDIIEKMCEAFQCDFAKIRAVFNKTNEIRKIVNRSDSRYIQELILMGYLNDESVMVVADKYLRKDRRRIYGRDKLKMPNYIDKDWLLQLDNEILVCGIATYRLEVERFIDAIERLVKVL